MLSIFPFSPSHSLSYAINCGIQSPMFKWLDEKTEETEWVRFPAACAFIASNIITTATRITGVAESLLFGSVILLHSPFSQKKMENAKLGLHEISVHTPKNILRVAFVTIEVCVDGIFGVLMNPKFYIMHASECMKVNLEHSKKGTIGSLEHSRDSSEASGNAYNRLLRRQGVIS
jgi:hypothetical protein